jgi:periplasmic protein TonB
MMRWMLFVALAALLAAPAHAQTGRLQPPPDDEYELSAVDVMPQPVNIGLLTRVMGLVYPPALRDAGISGTVTLRFIVLRSGAVDPESVQVVNATHPGFADGAAVAIRILQFRPAEVDGKPVRVWVVLPVSFTTGAG